MICFVRTNVIIEVNILSDTVYKSAVRMYNPFDMPPREFADSRSS